MKFLLSESKLDQVVLKYLDNQDFVKIDNGDYVYFINSQEDKYSLIRFSRVTNKCAVKAQLVHEISDFFSIKSDKAIEIVMKWVEKTLDVNAYSIEFGSIRWRNEL